MLKPRNIKLTALSLGISSAIALAISYFSEINFLLMWAIIIISMMINGYLAELEDNQPGGFHNPKPKHKKEGMKE